MLASKTRRLAAYPLYAADHVRPLLAADAGDTAPRRPRHVPVPIYDPLEIALVVPRLSGQILRAVRVATPGPYTFGGDRPLSISQTPEPGLAIGPLSLIRPLLPADVLAAIMLDRNEKTRRTTRPIRV